MWINPLHINGSLPQNIKMKIKLMQAIRIWLSIKIVLQKKWNENKKNNKLKNAKYSNDWIASSLVILEKRATKIEYGEKKAWGIAVLIIGLLGWSIFLDNSFTTAECSQKSPSQRPLEIRIVSKIISKKIINK